MIAWCMKKGRATIWYEHFGAAWWDWKSHEGEWRFIFPVLIPRKIFQGIKEFDGW